MFNLNYSKSKKDFIELYHDDLSKYGNVLPGHVSDINDMVLEGLYGVLSQDEYDKSSLEASITAKNHNERILTTYAVDDSSKLPKYAFDQLMDDCGDLSEEQIKMNIENRHLNFYSKVMEVDSILSNNTLSVLGEEYKQYAKKHLEQRHERRLKDNSVTDDLNFDMDDNFLNIP